MSLVILPSSADEKKVFWIVGCPPYTTTGIPTHLPYRDLALMGLTAAQQQNAETITVEIQGFRPQSFPTSEVAKWAQSHSDYCRGLVSRTGESPQQRAIARDHQRRVSEHA